MVFEDCASKGAGSNVNIQQPTPNIQFPRKEDLTLVVLLGCFDTAEQDGDPFISFLHFFICSLDIECWLLDIPFFEKSRNRHQFGTPSRSP